MSKKYEIPIQTIKDYSAANTWSEKRTEYKLNTNQKIIEKTSEKLSDNSILYKNDQGPIGSFKCLKIERELNNKGCSILRRKVKGRMF